MVLGTTDESVYIPGLSVEGDDEYVKVDADGRFFVAGYGLRGAVRPYSGKVSPLALTGIASSPAAAGSSRSPASKL